MDHCYVCLRLPLEGKETQDRDAITYRCRCTRCGVYDIAHKMIAGEKNGSTIGNDTRMRLSHATRKATDAHDRFVEIIDYETVKQIAEQHPLPDAIEQADIFIDCIARRCSYGTPSAPETIEVWAARIGLEGARQLKFMSKELSQLVAQSGLGKAGSATPASQASVQFTLTLQGWKRARDIRQQRGPGNQAFIAMWFNPGMDVAFDEGFGPALLDTGHQPYRVDRDAHNNKIDDQIIAQIRRSKLLIVDTTGARPNAYYEAGFAAGLGIPVIWCCCDSATAPGLESGTWKDNLPFDIRQHAFTFWSEPADLKKKLTDRIRALGFDEAWNRGQ